MKALILDLWHTPRFFWSGVFCIWKRNYLDFRVHWLVSTLWIFLEPMLLLFGVGLGLGHFISSVGGQPYIYYFAPSVAVISGVYISFYETTYGSFNKIFKDKVYEITLLSPISVTEIVLGEIIWSMTKSSLAALIVLGVSSHFGWIPDGKTLILLAPCLLIFWFFSALGLLFCSYVKSANVFLAIYSLFILPITLFSETYFPPQFLNMWVRKILEFSPLTQGMRLLRDLQNQPISYILGQYHWIILLALSLLITNWAVSRFERLLKE